MRTAVYPGQRTGRQRVGRRAASGGHEGGAKRGQAQSVKGGAKAKLRLRPPPVQQGRSHRVHVSGDRLGWGRGLLGPGPLS